MTSKQKGLIAAVAPVALAAFLLVNMMNFTTQSQLRRDAIFVIGLSVGGASISGYLRRRRHDPAGVLTEGQSAIASGLVVLSILFGLWGCLWLVVSVVLF